MAASTSKTKSTSKNAYLESVGRRKTAVARVRVTHGENDFIVNNKPLAEYFQDKENQRLVRESLEQAALNDSVGVSVLVSGGGTTSQAEAVRQGIARALVKEDEDLRGRLKAAGHLTRDSRMRERKKFGLKRARRRRQWRKR